MHNWHRIAYWLPGVGLALCPEGNHLDRTFGFWLYHIAGIMGWFLLLDQIVRT